MSRRAAGFEPTSPLHLLFVSSAFLLEVDPHESRGELGQEPGGADHADKVGDRKCDRDAVDHRRGFGVGQAQPRDCITRRSNRRRLGERASNHAGRRSRIVAKQPADCIGDDQARRGNDHRQRRLQKPIAPQTAKELRAGPEPDGEQEQEEEALFDFTRYLNAQLPDRHAGQERTGDGTEREAPQLHLPEQVPDPEDKEEGDLGVVAKKSGNRLDHCLRPHGLL